jgi:uncharacterized protein (DUF427 family)
VEPCERRARIVHGGVSVADSRAALRVLETSHPPGIYLPPGDVDLSLLEPSATRTWCEFKGGAVYWSLRSGDQLVPDVAWSYPDPSPGYEPIRDHLSFYPSRVDACFLDDEQVEAQEGGFYGGWITSDITGPFKGAPGTRGW